MAQEKLEYWFYEHFDKKSELCKWIIDIFARIYLSITL